MKRAEKMGKMGHPAQGVCGECWKQYKSDWDKHPANKYRK